MQFFPAILVGQFKVTRQLLYFAGHFAQNVFIHDRMPLILPEQFVGEWIKPETRPDELVKEAKTEMYFEKA